MSAGVPSPAAGAAVRRLTAPNSARAAAATASASGLGVSARSGPETWQKMKSPESQKGGHKHVAGARDEPATRRDEDRDPQD